jgi:hypothetical protein
VSEVRFGENRVVELRPRENRVLQVRTGEVRARGTSSLVEFRVGEVGRSEACARRRRLVQFRLGQRRPGEVRVGERFSNRMR